MIGPKPLHRARMLWGLAIVAVLALVMAFRSHSPGQLGLFLAIGLGCAIGAALGFIDRHVRASGRPEHMTQRELEALRATLRKPTDTPPQLPPSHHP